MPRPPREIEPGVCYHVLNRGNNRQAIFRKPADYAAFLAVLAEAVRRFDVELLCWCLMPNHWHLVVRPKRAGSFPEFMRWLTLTHVRRHHEHYQGQSGHLYQGRYKSFPVEQDDHFLRLCRYVEGNALRAEMVRRAQDWEWSSLFQRTHRRPAPPLTDWPVDRPRDWADLVNQAFAPADLAEIQTSLARGRPLGTRGWVKRTAAKLGLEHSVAARGRPRLPDSELSARSLRRRKGGSGQKDM